MRRVLVLLALAAQPGAAVMSETRVMANPIRKVVNLLQAMQKKIQAEGETAQELYEKFMCYCQTSGGDLQASIAAAEKKIGESKAALEAATSKKKQLESDLKEHKADRAAAKQAMAEATALREKEKAAFDKSLAEFDANIGSVKAAVAAISKGMDGSFLQTGAAAVLRSLTTSSESMSDGDRQELLSFLSGGSSNEYAPASGEIVGILKQMGDTMVADRKDLIATEEAKVKDYEAMMVAKKKEVATLSNAIETKLARVGEIGVEIATIKEEVGDAAESIEEDKKFAKDLKKNCAEKTGIHEKEKEVRGEELVALADTIKILNDDDALDLFKKTLPSASSSFLQVQRTSESVRAEARALLSRTRNKAQGRRHKIDFVLLALHGKKVGFDKIVKLIDALVASLKKEQVDDDDKKEYCTKEFDVSEDKKKAIEQGLADLETVIEESKEGIATTTDEIKALKEGIVELDKQVSEATVQRKAESAEYKDLMQSDAAAQEVLLFAKNRLNKFYNPKLYKAPPKEESEESFAQEAPPPPPATAAAYTKKAEESNGVIAMMDLMVADLEKEMTVAKTEEKNAQAEYEEMIADAGEKRRQDSKSVTDKESSVAAMQEALEKSKAEKKSAKLDLMGVEKILSSLHGECDWLMKYYDTRKEARNDEIEGLSKAKDVLHGADYSLLQRAHHHQVTRHA